MSEDIIMPKLGMTMEEGTVDEWHKSVGDTVEENEAVVTISSEKLTQEVEAPTSGVLFEIKVDTGDDVKVGGVLGIVGQEDENTGNVNTKDSGSIEITEETKTANTEEKASQLAPAEVQTKPDNGERIFISPLARRMAKDNNLQIERIKGTGGNNRITRLDVNRVLDRGHDHATEEQTPGQEPTPSTRKEAGYQDIGEGLSPMRKAIAQNMRNSQDQTAQLTLHRKARINQLIDFQKTLRKEAGEAELDLKLSLTVMIARATVLALRDYQKMNAVYQDGKLSEFDEVHLGIATSLDEGLVVPVVRNAEQKTIGSLARAMEDVTTAAQNGRAGSDLLSGSTFTITNMGASGIEYFTPILNSNETGILGVGALQEELDLNDDGQVVKIKNVPFSLTFDHQILDGADAAEFLSILVKYIESPYLLVL